MKISKSSFNSAGKLRLHYIIILKHKAGVFKLVRFEERCRNKKLRLFQFRCWIQFYPVKSGRSLVTFDTEMKTGLWTACYFNREGGMAGGRAVRQAGRQAVSQHTIFRDTNYCNYGINHVWT